jgi:hypothetical protein
LRVDFDAPKRGFDHARGAAFDEMRPEFVQHMRPRLAARCIEHGDEILVAGPDAKPRSGAPKAEIVKARFARIAPNKIGVRPKRGEGRRDREPQRRFGDRKHNSLCALSGFTSADGKRPHLVAATQAQSRAGRDGFERRIGFRDVDRLAGVACELADGADNPQYPCPFGLFDRLTNEGSNLIRGPREAVRCKAEPAKSRWKNVPYGLPVRLASAAPGRDLMAGARTAKAITRF